MSKVLINQYYQSLDQAVLIRNHFWTLLNKYARNAIIAGADL